MPTTESIARIHAYSARRLGSEERHFASGLTVIHSYPADATHRFNVIATRRLDGGCVILAHDHLLPAIAGLEGGPAGDAFDETRLRDAYADRTIERGVSAAQAYGDATDLREPPATGEVQTIERLDDPAWIELREATPGTDWLEGSMDEATPPIFTTMVAGTVAAAAHANAAGDVRWVGVLTHPGHRGHGHARTVAYALARHWTSQGAVLEWQARLSNTASLLARDALGFVEMYRSIAMRVV